MFLILRRDQRRSLTGKAIFRLDVHAEIEPFEMQCIERYGLKGTVLYTKHILVDCGRGLLGLISRLFFRAINISISVGDLVHGKRVECRNIIEMLAVEDQVREAAKTFKLVLNAATRLLRLRQAFQRIANDARSKAKSKTALLNAVNERRTILQLTPLTDLSAETDLKTGLVAGTATAGIEATPYITDDGHGGYIVESVPFGRELLSLGRRLPASDWWGEGVLSGIGATTTLTRLQVVRIMRDQDGGAHLDDHIKDKTYLAVYVKGTGFLYKPSAESKVSLPVEGALEATVRQMAHEILSPMRGLAHSAQHALREAAKTGPLYPQYFEVDSGKQTTPT